MKQTVKRGFALLMTVVMCLSLIPAMAAHASAASGYVYNWGSRGTVATSLSESAESFYTENNTTYAELSQISGGTSEADAPSSELYATLQKLMKDNHTTITSYADVKGLCKYTDCQNDGGKISAFYSGAEVGPEWDGSWNREHTWPDSKGLAGSDEDDIIMLRPTTTSENSSRGNKAYGESSGFYDPNAASNGTYNLHGDVARIMLYVYVRWGNTEKMWGTTGVMENLDVLIKWMAEDPVDTWELGRNDSVESITGTRNVFVDYPELAFLLFNEDIPTDMTTPSGEAKTHKNCDHQYQAGTPVAATCTAKGYTPYTCSLCQKVLKKDYTNMIDHTYVDGVCSCGAKTAPEYVTDVTVGNAYKLGLYSTAKSAEFFFTGTMSGYYGATSTDYDKGVDVYLEETSGGYYLYFKNSSGTKQYINLVASGTYRNFKYGTTASSVFSWNADKDALYTTVSNEICYMGTYGSYVTMGVLQNSKLKDTDYIARLYTKGSTSSEGGETPHEHSYTAVVTAPTCTEGGYTTHTCSCGDSYKDAEVPATGHNYVSGTCSVCGQADPNGSVSSEPTVVTAPVVGNAYKLGLYSTAKSAEYYFTGAMSGYYGATDTNYDKGVDVYLEETSGGYYLYFKNSSGTKQYINLVASGTYRNFKYGTTASSVFSWNADKDALYTTVSNEICYMGTYGSYVTMGVLQNSKLKATDYIARLYTKGSTSGEGGETPHEHSYTAVVTAPTCTENGYTTHTCSCGDSYKDAEVPATGHTYVNGVCSCGAKEPTTGGEPTSATITFNNKSKRTEFTTSKQVWTENGITVTNNKGASTSNVADYASPARFYKSSQLIIAYPAMTKIEVACNSASYATALKASITSGTVTVSGSVVTITLSEASDSYTIASLSGGQVRVDSITVYAEASQPEHKHSYEAVVTAPTCTKDGYTTYTCTDTSCGDSYTADPVPATGHSWNDATCEAPKTCGKCNATEGELGDHKYENGTCAVCGQADPDAPSGKPTTATITFNNKSKRTEFTTSKQVWTENGITVTNNKASSSNNMGDYVNPVRFYAGSELIIAYPGMTKIEVTCNSNSYATDLKNSVTGATVSGQVVTITLSEAADTYTIAKLGKQVRVDSITVYAEASQPEHKHSYEAVVTAPTCTENGYTTHTCSCGDSYKDTEVPATGHNYVDGTCSVCGEADPNASISVPTTATIKFNTTSQRTSQNSTKQVWASDGFTITNNKAASSSPVANYYNPVRFYASSNLVLEYPGLNKIVFTCSSSSYATALKNSIPTGSGTVTVSGSVVTLTLANAADTFTIPKLSAQVRMNSITVHGTVSQPAHKHSYEAVVTAPTCTKDGYTTYTCTDTSCGDSYTADPVPATGHSWNDATCTAPKTCATCGTTEGEALGHSWNDATCEAPKTCGTCGATDGNALGHTYAKSMTTAPTCTSAGIAVYTCTRCGNSNASAIPARGHVWVNGICSVCGEKNQSSEGMNSAQLCGGGKDCILHAFSDINVGAWYHDGVHYCVEHALFQGLPGGKFGPTETTTRAQLITILWRLEGSPVVNYLMDFDDVESEQWYTEAVRWAASEKIVGGYGNGLFGINDAITREQMAAILWRYAQYKKQDVSVGENTNILSYGDAAQVNTYAIPAMQWACGAGLVQGIAADNTMNLDPTGSANRAQVATILYRYCEEFAK